MNVGGAVALLEAMLAHGVGRLVFSSSATVYGTPETNPIPESAPLAAANPYGRTKLMIEETLGELVAARPAFAAVSLRYFNPVGAHASGLIGEDPSGVPNNLFPFVAQTAAGVRERVRGIRGRLPDAGRDGGPGLYPRRRPGARAPGGHRLAAGRGGGGAQHRRQPGAGGAQRARGGGGLRQGGGAGDAPCHRRPAAGRRGLIGRRRGAGGGALRWRAELDLDRMCADQWAFQRGLLQR